MTPKQQLDRDSYVILDVLDGDELSLFRQRLEPVYERVQREQGRSCRVSLFDPKFDLAFLHEPLYRPVCWKLVESLLGPDLVFAGGALIVGLEGQEYNQGWHRDILQIPEDQLDDRQFAPNWRHNCIQVNLALLDDDSFWCVPGSANRPNTPAERAVFSVRRHESPIGADMPGGKAIAVKAGQGIFYNNNLIHRGHNAQRRRRLTLHYAYHSGDRPPSVHFYNRTFTNLDPAYVETLGPEIRAMYARHMQDMARYPDVKAAWRLPEGFVPEYQGMATA